MRRSLSLVLSMIAVACSGSSGSAVDPPPSGEGIAPRPSDDPPAPEAAPESGERSTTEAPGTLRVMSYNIKFASESSLEAIAAVIQNEKPDIVGLQEVDELTNRSGKVRQTTTLAKLTGMHGEFGASFAFDGGQYGLAVLSKTPLTNLRVFRLDNHTKRENGYEPRIAFAADTTAKGRSFSFVTVHASLHEEERPHNASMLHATACTGGPAIIVGDMNETPGEAIGKELLGAGYVDAHAQKTSNPFEGLTAPAMFPTRRIDFVYKHSSFGKTKFSWVPSTTASDHRPVMVTFDTQ